MLKLEAPLPDHISPCISACSITIAVHLVWRVSAPEISTCIFRQHQPR